MYNSAEDLLNKVHLSITRYLRIDDIPGKRILQRDFLIASVPLTLSVCTSVLKKEHEMGPKVWSNYKDKKNWSN
jgi:hypothetical protein